MKVSELRGWVADLLRAHGATVESRGQLMHVEVPEALAPRLGAASLVLAFTQRGLQENARSELATVGNPVFDRILELAESSGRLGIRYETLPGRRTAPDPLTGVRLTNGARGFGPPRIVYTPVYQCLFRVRTSVEEVPDELEAISVDGITRNADVIGDEVAESWEQLGPEPASDQGVIEPYPLPEWVVTTALQMLEHRLARRVSRLRRASEQRLAEERQNINTYYETLIEEAKTAPLRGGRGPESRQEKERLLKLDWKRRVEEAQTFWSPRVDVTLSAVAAVMRPRWSFALVKGKREDAVFAEIESNQFLIPPGVSGVTLLDS